MNVLILTPDRVGSTLLQRLITVYMQFGEFNKPVINLHELTNGLIKYYSTVFNREVLGKHESRLNWGYYQSLNEIAELLNSVDHYKTSRLAHYHIKARNDSISDQQRFYNYLNDNFFIISAQRKNLLDHALSWGIYTHSKKLNVYSHAEKLNVYEQLYKNKIIIDTAILVKYLDAYKDYLNWCDRHFSIARVFTYEHDMKNLEKFILSLSCFNQDVMKISWKASFGQEFSDWNMCHYLLGDLSGLGQQVVPIQNLLEYSAADQQKTYQLKPVSETEIFNSLTVQDQKFLIDHGTDYVNTSKILNELVDNKILPGGIPIKLQTLLEKKLLIKNFDECVEMYNLWVSKNKIGDFYTDEELSTLMLKDFKQWHADDLISYQFDQHNMLQ